MIDPRWMLLPILGSVALMVSGARPEAAPTRREAVPRIAETFTYQGVLTNASGPIGGECDFQFSLWDDVTNGKQIGPTVPFDCLLIDEGLVSVKLDFGAGAFNGDDRWLQIDVGCFPCMSGNFDTMLPRQLLTAAPYAIRARALGLAPNVVKSFHIERDAVGKNEIANDAVGSAEIATNAVGRDEIDTGAVGIDEIDTDAVGEQEIASNAVGSSEIQPDSVFSSHIASDFGILPKITNGVITFGITQGVGIGVNTPNATLGIRHLPNSDDPILKIETENGTDIFLIDKLGRVGIGEVVAPLPEDLYINSTTLFNRTVNITSGLNVESLQVRRSTPLHVATFRNDNPIGDGITIRINNARPTSANSFVTFLKNSNSQVAGRIVGFDAPTDSIFNEFEMRLHDVIVEIFTNPTQFPFANLGCFFNFFDTIPGFCWNPPVLPEICIPDIRLPFSVPYPKINLFTVIDCMLTDPVQNPVLNDFACFLIDNGFESYLTMDPFGIATALVKLRYAEQCRDGGVSYCSTGGDYAEWLSKVDPNEKIGFGQIVGVRGGKISKDTTSAEQVMDVSMNPIVLGNTPPEGEEEQYEKVAFMGQVPMWVRGRVQPGDYIRASGYNDGSGVAVSPEDLLVDQLPRIVGRAISESTSDGIGLVNLLVGVQTGAPAAIAAEQADRIEELEHQLESLRAQLAQAEELSIRLARVEALMGVGSEGVVLASRRGSRLLTNREHTQ